MATYVKVTYSVSSTTSPTCVARYEKSDQLVEDWIDHVTIGSSGGTAITIEPWAPEGTDIWYYAYTFPTTGNQDLYFFSKTNEIPDYAFNSIQIGYSPGYILSIDCSQSNNDITGIGQSTFSLNYFMQSAYLSDNITKMGRNAFESSSAMTVCNIPESLSAIPASMFQFCRSLEHVRIPDSVQSIGTSAFAGCTSLEDVYIGSGLTAFYTYSFGDCSSLTSITATSKNVPITYYTNTFKNVHTGGTLYYPEGYDSEYGPESGMLSTEEYLLGYYDWSGVTTGSPSDSYIRFANSAVTTTAQNAGLTTPLEYSGCTVDTGTCEIISVVGDIPVTGAGLNYSSYEQRYNAWFRFDQNVTTNDRSSVVTVRFYDTDWNSYDSTITIYQPAGEFLIYRYGEGQGFVPQEGGTYTDEVIPINTSICSVQLVSSGIPYNPEYWEGVEKPTISIIGNYINIDWPANPFENTRVFNYIIRTIYGDNCENNITSTFFHTQEAYEAPSQKDIEAEDTDYSVGSGTGNASTAVQVSGCTYDHFTYITGGSFSVTATSGPDNTIVFTYPENPTTSARTGYVYITFYDSDGNTYGPQTITFTQQAGSSPGPGPGPDPETGYVLTTLTISDQEQHRYFVEARPGVVYSAAGQYYKTISACEARYSLYYVNSYGGVDVLPFKEKSWKKSDTVTRFNYSRSFRNNTLEFENVNYMNEIKASWELHTGWMSDESSQRMHELVESTIVYLYDAEEKTYTPVVMTDKKLEYKTYHNQGKKFYNYTVNVEESQSRERR